MEMPKVKVANFEGPFDLLLHLIRKHEMDIYNVEIYKITNQYLKYLDDMKVMDLEVTSEFIVVAATLIEIKSKKLLPKVKEEEESEEDIEKNLLEKLIEYKKIKGVSGFFRERYISAGDVYPKKAEIIEETESETNNDDIFKNTTLLDLYSIYNSLLENYTNKQNTANIIQKKIYVDKYKIEDKMESLLNLFNIKEIMEFDDLVNECECKLEVVVTFLALLELIKIRMVKIYQDDNFGNILVKRRKSDG
ncbi:segregation/condensation protein A [Clostridium gasigenes]|uniref:Segregation and condensation protein A n=1 Tax=Clostridium gasigenes TaxID=94869 RepID=A0A1H0N132_9CLOT|nr:segregation/condensation protein A [Clostridium gasigenes]MBB6625202.1 segregation/condensation protein A [Clostridium gasigenes]MBU3087394.1 segregation/condensation protein A [Clostridium gasigenes]MBU3135085.1 segregation/condensation protein A [Clostridium gasigenes]SDO86367.1 condensin subunit ScpA [Clostridium gasigenes]